MITHKKVSRWFYNGKGYATRSAAYKAWAKSLLLDLIYDNWRSWNAGMMDEEQDDYEKRQVEHFDALAAVHFPHDESKECHQYCRTGEYNAHAWKSCKGSMRRWISDKATELIESYAKEATPGGE